MRPSFLLGLLVLLFLPSTTTAQSFEVSERVSDVTGVRQITSADLRPLPGGSYSGSHAAFRAVYEKPPDEDASWTLTVFGYASDTTALSRTRTVRLRADASSIEPRRIETKVRPLDASRVEIVQIGLSRSAFASVAHAKRVVLSIGPAQFSMSHVLRTDLRLILDHVSSAPPRRASQTGAPDANGADANHR
jgi:hypothetical protein